MCNQPNIKALTRHMVMRAGGAKKSAHICGVTDGELSYWCNDRHDRFIPVDHLMDLDQQAGDLFLKAWARERGYELTPLDAKANNAASVIHTIAQLSRSSGELECTTLEAAEDNNITPAERRRIFDDIAPVKDSISRLEAAISQ